MNGHVENEAGNSTFHHGDMLVVKKQRSKNKPLSSHRLSGGRSLSILSPTAEEKIKEEQSESVYGQAAHNSSACPDPPCTSGSLRLASSPLKEDVYSPSSSSNDGTFPSGMIPLPDHLEEPTDPESLDKENKNPRPSVATAVHVESPRMEDPFGHDSKQQQQHFMSTPTFSSVNPPKSSRKKTRHSKESSSSTGKDKSNRGSGSPAKLQKKSPASVERGKSKDQKKSKQNGESPKNETLQSRDYNAELSQFVADWTALDMRRKVLQTAKSKNELQNFKAVLDAEQSNLEARYEAIKADKAASERNLAILKVQYEAIKAQSTAVEKTNASPEPSHENDLPPRNPARILGSAAVLRDNSDSKKKKYSNADLDTLESALEASQRERQTLELSRSELGSDWKAFFTEWEPTNADLDTANRDAKLNTEYASLKNRALALDAAEDASRANVEAIVARLSSLDETRQRHPNRELSIQPLGTVGGNKSYISPSKGKQKCDEWDHGSSHIMTQPGGDVDADQRHAAIQTLASHSGNQQDSIKTAFGSCYAVTHIPEAIRAELGAFKADVTAWKTKWKSFNQGKQTISSSDKRLRDDEKAALDARWDTLKARMDAQIEVDDTKEPPKPSPSLPFKHLVGEADQSLSVPSPPKPGITISGASPHDFGEVRQKSPRRIGVSEPGLLPRDRSRSPRRVSRSLYEDLGRRRNLLDFSKVSRDPLSRVSRKEDDASLAVLAQALDADADDDVLETMPKQASAEKLSSPGSESRVTRPTLLREISTIVENVDGPPSFNTNGSKDTTSDDVALQSDVPEVSELERATDKPIEQPSEIQVPNSDQAATPFGIGMIQPNLEPDSAELPQEIAIPSSAMQIPTEKSVNPVRRSNIPISPTNKPTSGDANGKKAAGSPSKISALVARFNQGKRDPTSTSTSSPTTSPAKSPTKTPTRTVPGLQADSGTPKDGIVSPYTTNPVSSTRSQKSEKTPQSIRTTAAGEARSLLDPKSSPVRKPTPKRILRNSLYDSTPLRPVSWIPGAKSPRSTPSPTKAPNPYAVSLRSVQKNTDGSPSRVSSRPSDVVQDTCELDGAAIEGQKASPSMNIESAVMAPPPRFEIDSRDSAEVHVKESSASSSRTVRAVRKSTKEVNTRIENAVVEVDQVQLTPVETSHVHEGLSSLPVFDGPPGASNIGRVLPRPDPVPVAHHLQLTRPPTTGPADSANMGLPSANQIISPPPGRSSSLLYNQVRDLQRQLSEKTEEIQHLKQQLSARGNLDIGTLSEELRETKRDLQSWKARAEVAEKQLEILMKMPSRSNSLKHTHSTSSRRSDHQNSSSVDFRKEEGTMADRIRKALHGMDGAGSPKRWNSDGSTETVIRDLREVVTDSEYSMWAEQTMNAIDSADSEEKIR